MKKNNNMIYIEMIEYNKESRKRKKETEKKLTLTRNLSNEVYSWQISVNSIPHAYVQLKWKRKVKWSDSRSVWGVRKVIFKKIP